MNSFLDIFTIFISSWVLLNFWKTIGQRWKVFFSFLVGAALFPPFSLILENKSEAAGRKSLILKAQLAIRKSFENIDP